MQDETSTGATARGYRLADIAIAASLLTRAPLPLDHDLAARRIARAGWAFPVIGAAVGLAGGLVYALASLGGVPPFAAAALALGLQAMATGALHEDGLADTVDGLGAPGRSVAERLAIMRDSRLGAFGGLALMIIVAVKLGAVSALAPWTGCAALTAAGALGRATAPALMARLSRASEDGLSARAGRGDPGVAMVAVVLALGLAGVALWLAMGGQAALPRLLGAALATVVGAALIAVWAQRRLGGQTGDILGAAVILAETAALVWLSAA